MSQAGSLNNGGGGGSTIENINVQTGISPVVTSNNTITFNGAVVAAGTNPVRTDGTALSTMALEVQTSQAIASTDATKIGLSAFNSADFTVDANGFVSIVGGPSVVGVTVDAHTAPGTSPVVPNASGDITVTGAQVAAGTTTNVIRTDSLAANTYTIEIQRSQAVASSTIGDNGVSHYNSAQFAVDANGFVSLNGSGVGETITGQSGGALSPTAGNWNISGASTAAGTSPVVTSGSGSTLTVNVQKAQAIASTDATKIGLAAFNSANFTVDANGFVSSTGSSGITTIDGNTGSVTGSTVTIETPASTGTLNFSGSGTTMTLNLIDSNGNLSIGTAPVIGGGCSNCVILGTNAGSNAAGSVVIGNSASDNGNTACVCIGNSVGLPNASDVIGIGNGAVPHGAAGIAIGKLASCSSGSSIAIGSSVTAGASGAVSIGHSASATGGSSVCIGSSASDGGGGPNVVIGSSATGSGTGNSIVIGPSAGSTAASSVCIGQSCSVTGSGNSIGIGAGVVLTGNTAICIGNSTVDHGGTGNVVIGSTAIGPSGGSTISLGPSAGSSNTTGGSNITIGNVGVSGESHVIRIGTQGSGTGQQDACYIAGVAGVTVSNTNIVTIDTSTGQLGSTAGGSVISTINGDSGSVTGSTISIISNVASSAAGSTVQFTGSGTTLTFSDTDGSLNTAIGNLAGSGSTASSDNSTYLGYQSGLNSASINECTFLGNNAGSSMGSALAVTSVGYNAGAGAGAAFSSVFVGDSVATGGASNKATFVGSNANVSGSGCDNSTFVGYNAGANATNSTSCTYIGYQAGDGASSNTHCIYIGDDAGNGISSETGVIRLGSFSIQSSCFIGGIAGVTVSNSAAVLIDTTTGQLGTVVSSRRYKENIKDLKESNVLNLRPVSFNYIDFPGHGEQHGLIAEEVHEVMPNLVTYDKEGRPDSVKYHDLPIFLLNEIQKLKQEIEFLKKRL
jgi:hypothetical protein